MAAVGVISAKMAATFAVPQITSKERLPSSASTSHSSTEEFIVVTALQQDFQFSDMELQEPGKSESENNEKSTAFLVN